MFSSPGNSDNGLNAVARQNSMCTILTVEFDRMQLLQRSWIILWMRYRFKRPCDQDNLIHSFLCVSCSPVYDIAFHIPPHLLRPP